MAYNLFDIKRATVPLHLQHLVSEIVLKTIVEFKKSLRHIQRLYDARHEAMCPTYPSPYTSKNVEALERLVAKLLPKSRRKAKLYSLLDTLSEDGQTVPLPHKSACLHNDQFAIFIARFLPAILLTEQQPR